MSEVGSCPLLRSIAHPWARMSVTSIAGQGLSDDRRLADEPDVRSDKAGHDHDHHEEVEAIHLGGWAIALDELLCGERGECVDQDRDECQDVDLVDQRQRLFSAQNRRCADRRLTATAKSVPLMTPRRAVSMVRLPRLRK